MTAEERKKTVLFTQISYVLLFFFPLISIIYAYIKRPDCKGDPVLLAHINYQINTFWIFVISTLIILLVTFVLAFIYIGLILGPILGFLLSGWLIYRIVKGFIRLGDGRLPN